MPAESERRASAETTSDTMETLERALASAGVYLLGRSATVGTGMQHDTTSLPASPAAITPDQRV